MKQGDKVRSHLSLWKGGTGTISGIVDRPECLSGDLVHVIFPETDKHYGYQQSFNSKDLVLVQEVKPCDCQDYKNGLVSNCCPIHNENPDVYGQDYPNRY